MRLICRRLLLGEDGLIDVHDRLHAIGARARARRFACRARKSSDTWRNASARRASAGICNGVSPRSSACARNTNFLARSFGSDAALPGEPLRRVGKPVTFDAFSRSNSATRARKRAVAALMTAGWISSSMRSRSVEPSRVRVAADSASRSRGQSLCGVGVYVVVALVWLNRVEEQQFPRSRSAAWRSLWLGDGGAE
jgi:hypothetical protein